MEQKVFRKISYGLYVVASQKDDKINGQISNSVIQITSDPPTVAVSLNKGNLTNEFVKASKVFSISILAKEAQLSIVGNFGFKSGRDVNKYESVQYKKGVTGSPIVLEQTVGYLEAEVFNSVDIGTHTIFIGKVIEAEVFNELEPMTYALYQQIKKGATPLAASAAPTEQKQKIMTVNDAQNIAKTGKEEKKMKKYECSVCGYVYDPQIGDPDSGIAPGTAFEDIPDSWVCPVCGVGKDSFEEVN